MKKIAIVFASLLLATSLVGCGEATPPPEEEPPTETPTVCEHVYTEQVTKEALPLADGTIVCTCEKCGDSYEKAIPATKSIKILGIGNSFTEDSLWHLWDVCKSGGIENVTIAFLFIGGSQLSDHWNNIQQDAKKYVYYENTNGLWKQSSNYSVSRGLKKHDWDIITVQQGSAQSGIAETHQDLGSILGYLEKNKPTTAKIWYHMTWACQTDCYANILSRYNNDQMTMYNAITKVAQETVAVHESITDFIVTGTAIQNVRTSYISNSLTLSDGHHLSKGVGRYIASLTWFATLSGVDASYVTWVPDDNAAIRSALPLIYESVNNAVENKYTVTPSTFTK